MIIATYSRPGFLAEAVASVLRQTEPDLECIVVDDASPEAPDVPRDPRLRVLRQVSNQGSSVARNVGLRAARGRFVAFLDDDDLVTPHRLAIAREGLRDAAVAVCQMSQIRNKDDSDVQTESWERSPEAQSLTLGRFMSRGPLLHMGMACISREEALEFDETLRACEDVDWWIRLATSRPELGIALDPRVGYRMRRHAGTRFRMGHRVRLENRLVLLGRHADYFEVNPRVAALEWRRAGHSALAIGERGIARRAFARSLALAPDPRTAWLLAKAITPRPFTPRARQAGALRHGTAPGRVVLGIGGYLGHDANATLMVDGRLVRATEEERYSRKKHDGAFPRRAIVSCLEAAGLGAVDVDDVVFAEKPLQTALYDWTGVPGNDWSRRLGAMLPDFARSRYDWEARRLFPWSRFHYAWHHVAHVVGAFHTSPFSRAAFLCVDGRGEDYCTSGGTIDEANVGFTLDQPWDNGLGHLYTLVTWHLGFRSIGSEYKVMGLAPYGTPRFVQALGELFRTDADGGFRLQPAARFWPGPMKPVWNRITELTGVPARSKGERLSQLHADLAASLQWIFEEEILKMARRLRRETGLDQLLFCGGCAQNVVAAGRLRRERIFARIFNSPVGGDMGSSLGAALLLERTREPKRPLHVDARGFYLGSEPGAPPPEAAPWRIGFDGDLHEFIAAEIAQKKVVGWVRGGMELGARALGARSILADPRDPSMQSTLNMKVKFRESFRPFAPAILAERTGEWFDSTEESDYMNYVAHLRPERRVAMPETFESLEERLSFLRCAIPSVVHVDFSARLQTVRRDVHPDLHRLISAFDRLTGVPIVINTSFNVSGQPIVRTAAEAWECFVHTDMDLLVIDDAVFRNPSQYTREEKLRWLASVPR